MNPILAQQNGADEDAALIAILLFCGVIILVALGIQIMYLLTLSKALGRCHPRNRTMEPGMVWLNLIPLFQLVWSFIIVNRLADSLEDEFRDRGWHRRGEDYGRSLGTTTYALYLAGFIPYCGVIFSLAGLVCFIIYWVKIAGYSGQLVNSAPDDYGDYDDRDDDYDDRDDDYDRPWDRGRR